MTKMDLSGGNQKAIGVFISGSDNKELGWIPTFKEKEISVKLIVS